MAPPRIDNTAGSRPPQTPTTGTTSGAARSTRPGAGGTHPDLRSRSSSGASGPSTPPRRGSLSALNVGALTSSPEPSAARSPSSGTGSGDSVYVEAQEQFDAEVRQSLEQIRQASPHAGDAAGDLRGPIESLHRATLAQEADPGAAAAAAAQARDDAIEEVVREPLQALETELLVDGLADVVPNEAANLPPDAQRAYLDHLMKPVSIGTKLTSGATEFVAKAFASGLHFGAVQTYALVGSAKLAENLGIQDKAARATLDAVAVGLTVGVAHFVGELYLRTAISVANPKQLVPTDPAQAFPGTAQGDDTRRAAMKAKQAATKPGSLVGDFLAFIPFVAFNTGRGALGLTTPASTILSSALAGGVQSIAISQANARSTVAAADGTRIPTHSYVDTSKNPDTDSYLKRVEVGTTKAVAAGTKSVDASGKPSDVHGQIFGLLHEMFTTKGVGLGIGEFFKQLSAYQVAPEDSAVKRGILGGLGSFLLLEPFFIIAGSKGFSGNRGNTKGIGALTKKTFEQLTSEKDGGTRELLGVEDPDNKLGKLYNQLLDTADAGHQTGSQAMRFVAGLMVEAIGATIDISERVARAGATHMGHISEAARDPESLQTPLWL